MLTEFIPIIWRLFLNKKPTITDIAQAAGVSLATVSRILNNKPDVSEKTRKRVLKIIEEQGYAPQTQWQQIASGKRARY